MREENEICRRQETGTFSKKVLVENLFSNYGSVVQFLWPEFCVSKMWRDAANAMAQKL